MTGKTISNLKIGSQIQPENSKNRIEIPLVHNLLYNERNDQLLLRQDGRRLCCINLDVLNVILRGLSTPSCLLNTISRNVPSGDNLCMSSAPLMYT
jgi:hypothetical protein